MIEDITILKDAAAVAPYGMAGANGVVLVTTKRGKSGAPVLSYNGYIGFQNPTRITDQVNSYEYALMKNEAAMNAGYPNYYAYSQHDLEMYRKTCAGDPDADPDRYPNSNGLRDLVQNNSVITNHNLQLSGGSDKFQYYVSLGYSYQEGMWSTTDYQRFNLLANLSVDATKYTKISLSLGGWHEKKNYPGADTGDIMYQAYRTPPISAIQYSNGLWGQYVGKSLFGLTYRSGYRQEPADQLNTSLHRATASLHSRVKHQRSNQLRPVSCEEKEISDTDTCIHTGCITNSVSIRGRIPGTGETESGTIV